MTAILPRYKQWFDQIKISDKDVFDQKVIKFSEEAEQKVDCLACGQCCRTTVTTFTEADIQRISKHLGMKAKAFEKKYLFKDYDGMYTTTGVPCNFLELDTNKCTIYTIRPEACASFPHTSRQRFFLRRKAHLENSRFCGITQHVLDKLIEEYPV